MHGTDFREEITYVASVMWKRFVIAEHRIKVSRKYECFSDHHSSIIVVVTLIWLG